MSLRLRKLTAGGDTIVEVMIVLAVLGMAIGISYATANRSLLNARQAQENSEATQIAQSQVEALRAFSGNDPTSPNYIYLNSLFCINTSGVAPVVATGFTGSNPTNYAIYPLSRACNNGLYHVSINYGGLPNDTFTVQVIWDDVLGQGQDSVTLVYRVHP